MKNNHPYSRWFVSSSVWPAALNPNLISRHRNDHFSVSVVQFLDCGFLFLHCSVVSTVAVVLFQALCLCVPTSFLKATAVPVAPLPCLPQRSERRLLFCCVPMSFRRRRTRRCCRPRCRASGRTTSGCRRSLRARWLASSKSPSCCATSTSPVSLTQRHTHQRRDANPTSLYCTLSILILLVRQTHTHPLRSVHYHSLTSWILDLHFGEGVCKINP